MDLCWTVSTTDKVTLAYRSLGDSQVGKSVLVRWRVFDDRGLELIPALKACRRTTSWVASFTAAGLPGLVYDDGLKKTPHRSMSRCPLLPRPVNLCHCLTLVDTKGCRGSTGVPVGCLIRSAFVCHLS